MKKRTNDRGVMMYVSSVTSGFQVNPNNNSPVLMSFCAKIWDQESSPAEVLV